MAVSVSYYEFLADNMQALIRGWCLFDFFFFFNFNNFIGLNQMAKAWTGLFVEFEAVSGKKQLAFKLQNFRQQTMCFRWLFHCKKIALAPPPLWFSCQINGLQLLRGQIFSNVNTFTYISLLLLIKSIKLIISTFFSCNA